MKIVCAWCDEHMRGRPADVLVSHGICRDCELRFSAPDFPQVVRNALSTLTDRIHSHRNGGLDALADREIALADRIVQRWPHVVGSVNNE